MYWSTPHRYRVDGPNYIVRTLRAARRGRIALVTEVHKNRWGTPQDVQVNLKTLGPEELRCHLDDEQWGTAGKLGQRSEEPVLLQMLQRQWAERMGVWLRDLCAIFGGTLVEPSSTMTYSMRYISRTMGNSWQVSLPRLNDGTELSLFFSAKCPLETWEAWKAEIESQEEVNDDDTGN